MIVVNDINSTYSPKIASVSTVTPGTGTSATPTGPQYPGFRSEEGPSAEAAPAPVATPAAGPEGERGFLITISGYAPTGGYPVVTDFSKELMARAPEKGTKPYYFVVPTAQPGGHPIKDSAAPAGGGGMGFGGAPVQFGGGGGGGATGAAASDRPWGNVKGPYWDVFVPDLVGLKPVTAPTGALGMGMGAPAPTIPELGAIDLVATRAGPVPSPKNIAGAYTFVLKVRVHIRNDVKPAAAK
jgi:hypothetical protein